MKTRTMKIKLEFTEPVLGSSSANPEVHAEFIASKAKDKAKTKEEIEAVEKAIADIVDPEGDPEEQLAKAITIFPKDDTGVFMWDYQIRGFFKSAMLILVESGDEVAKGISKWSYKRFVDLLIFPRPRKIYLRNPAGQIITEAIKDKQRPLRCETLRGERVALANSQLLDPGTWMEFDVEYIVPSGSTPKNTLVKVSEDTIRRCLDYGQFVGLGQWRSGGFGRFTWSEIAEGEQKSAA